MRIVSDMSGANSFAFLIEGFDDKQIIINELTTCTMKYPEQMKETLDDMRQALSDIVDDMDKGYEEAEAVVNSIDKKGY